MQPTVIASAVPDGAARRGAATARRARAEGTAAVNTADVNAADVNAADAVVARFPLGPMRVYMVMSYDILGTEVGGTCRMW
ncbi:hypothetical protein [Streptomyces sp. NPDC056492]|uniref:hypothetical protein n=1 Tax=unclassified Streptomyces TaxID=2593676 RepID=UPI0036CD4684